MRAQQGRATYLEQPPLAVPATARSILHFNESPNSIRESQTLNTRPRASLSTQNKQKRSNNEFVEHVNIRGLRGHDL
jgi:hypothetical protein